MPRFYNAVLAKDTTDCTGPNTGSAQVSGGLYVAKQARISGIVNVLDTTPSTSYTNGAFIVGGGGGFGGDIFSAASIQGTRFVASALNALTTPAEAWIGPSITTGLYFKAGNVGVGPNANNPGYALDVKGSGATSGIRTDMGLDLNPVPNPSTGSLALVLAAGNVNAGLHYYVVTFITAQGETNGYVIGSVTTDGTHGQVDVTIPTSPDPRVTGRKLYRTKVGGNYWQTYSLATIGNNSQTTYTDNVADASLGALVGAGYWQINSTSKMITVGGVKAMALDVMGTLYGLLTGASLTTGGSNAFFAYRAGQSTTTGSNNAFFGDGSGVDNSTGSDNSYFGSGVGGPTTGVANLGGGRNALNSFNADSSYNVGLGWYALGGNGTPASASRVTAVGARAGYLAQGSNGIYLGADAGRYETLSNTLIIDALDRTNQTLSRSRALVYGVMNPTPANQTLALGGGGLTTINGGLALTAGTTTRPSMNIPDGAPPDIGTRGDIWAAGGHLYYHDGTSAKDLTAAGSGMTNPMTAVGDLVVGGTAGAPARLAIGTAGKILTVGAGTTPAWTDTIPTLTIDPGSGSANAPLILTGRNSGVANSCRIEANWTGGVTFTSNEADSYVYMAHASSTPTIGHYVGNKVRMADSRGRVDFSNILVQSTNVSGAGASAATMSFQVMQAGTLTEVMRLRDTNGVEFTQNPILPNGTSHGLQAKTSGATVVNLLALTNDTNNITRFISGVDAGGFQWTNQAQTVPWMYLSGSLLNVQAPQVRVGTSAGATDPQMVLTVIGGSNTDLAPVMEVYRTGSRVGAMSVQSAKLKFACSAGQLRTDAAWAAAPGMTLDENGAVSSVSYYLGTGAFAFDNAATGTTIRFGTGSSYDLSVQDRSGNVLFNTPTGTKDVAFAGRVLAPAAIAARASLRVPDGTAPSAPVGGDVWAVSGGLYYYNGTRTLNLTDVVSTATGNGATNLDGNQKTTIQVNVTGDTTLNMINGGANGQRLTLELKQDASGNHAITIGTGFAWGADITAYTPTLTALKTDYIGLVYNTTAAAWRIIAIAKGY